MIKQKYDIGLEFIHYSSKAKYIILDVYKTYNSKNDLVRVYYITSHVFNTQTLISELTQATIDRSI